MFSSDYMKEFFDIEEIASNVKLLVEVPDEVKNDILNTEYIETPYKEETIIKKETDKVNTMRIIRSTSFRDLVSFFYENKCALT
jgi:hypothetical protein